MHTLFNFIVHAIGLTILLFINATLGWWILDEFDLSYGTWFGIAIVGISIVRAGTALDDLWKGLTKQDEPVKITRMS